MMTTVVSAGLVGGLAIVLVLMVGGGRVVMPGCGVMSVVSILRYGYGRRRVFVGAACRWCNCCHSLHG